MHWWHFLGRVLCRFVACCHTFAEIAVCWCWITQPCCSGKKKKVLLTFGPCAIWNVCCEQPASPTEIEGTCFQAKLVPIVGCGSWKPAMYIIPPKPKARKVGGDEGLDLACQLSIQPWIESWLSKPWILQGQLPSLRLLMSGLDVSMLEAFKEGLILL